MSSFFSFSHIAFVRIVPLLLGVFLFFFSTFSVQAASSENLSKSLKSGKKLVEFSGKESDGVKIPKGVRVVGSGPDRAVINDDIVMENGSSLENVTVNGNLIPITVAKGASVTLINVTVRGGTDAGLFAPQGGGVLTIKNSRFLKNRKGLYILSGKGVNMTGNQITGNKEEGADMHGGISGTISGNTFSGNGEGGLEIIIDASSVSITENTFSANTASGLALQNYTTGKGKSTGKLSLNQNTFSGNGNFGIDCKNPQGGGSAANFKVSVAALGNVFGTNKLGNISGGCIFVNQVRVLPEAKDEEGEIDEELEEKREKEAEKSIPGEQFSRHLLEEAALLEKKSEQVAKEKNSWKSIFPRIRTEEEDRVILKKQYDRLKQEKNECVVIESRLVTLEKSLPKNCTPEEIARVHTVLEKAEAVFAARSSWKLNFFSEWLSISFEKLLLKIH